MTRRPPRVLGRLADVGDLVPSRNAANDFSIAARPLSLTVPGTMLIASSVKNIATACRTLPAVQADVNAAHVAATHARGSCPPAGRGAKPTIEAIRTAATTAKVRRMGPPVLW